MLSKSIRTPTMALRITESSSLRHDYHGPNCAYLCWLPIVMGFLSLSVGICCLFFTSRIGVILCILNCILGIIIPYITYSTHAHPKRYKAVVAIVGNMLHICLLVFTLIEGSCLLVLNVRAEAQNNAADISPTFNLTLNYYFAHAGFDSLREHILEAKAPDPSSSIDMRLSQREAGSGSNVSVIASPSSSNSGVSTPTPNSGVSTPKEANVSSSSMSDISPEKQSASQEKKQHTDMLLPTQTARFNAIVSSVSAFTKSLSVSAFERDGVEGGFGPSSKAVEEEQYTESKLEDKTNTSHILSDSLKEIPDNSRKDISSPNYNFSREDLNCILKAETSSVFGGTVLRRLRLLLFWGLFCGYVERGFILIKKKNIGCVEECHFDLFNFSKHKQNNIKTTTQAIQLLNHIQQMPTEQTRVCATNAAVASCRIEETFLHHGIAAALCAAIPLGCVLVIFCIASIIACWKIARTANKK